MSNPNTFRHGYLNDAWRRETVANDAKTWNFSFDDPPPPAQPRYQEPQPQAQVSQQLTYPQPLQPPQQPVFYAPPQPSYQDALRQITDTNRMLVEALLSRTQVAPPAPSPPVAVVAAPAALPLPQPQVYGVMLWIFIAALVVAFVWLAFVATGANRRVDALQASLRQMLSQWATTPSLL